MEKAASELTSRAAVGRWGESALDFDAEILADCRKSFVRSDQHAAFFREEIVEARSCRVRLPSLPSGARRDISQPVIERVSSRRRSAHARSWSTFVTSAVVAGVGLGAEQH
jgi:hypothetical protein